MFVVAIEQILTLHQVVQTGAYFLLLEENQVLLLNHFLLGPTEEVVEMLDFSEGVLQLDLQLLYFLLLDSEQLLDVSSESGIFFILSRCGTVELVEVYGGGPYLVNQVPRDGLGLAGGWRLGFRKIYKK